MDILKLSTDWAKAEVFSAKIVWIFSIITILVAIGFWYWGKTAMAKAFVWPLLIGGIFLLTVGAGLFFANKPRIVQFEKDYKENAQQFVQKELQRTSKSKSDLETVFKILPLLLVISGLIIYFFPIPTWRAIGITLALLIVFLMAVDSNTGYRNDIYNDQLKATLNH